MKPRVRFAPSPTGSLHIGGARTALFNWLFARHHEGTFILRIEDTDLERSTKEFEKSILDGMKWLGMDWDEGPFYQTERMDLYKTHVQKLLDEGKAYRCTCTPEELEAKRQQALAEGRKPKYDGKCRNGDADPNLPAAIRFKAPQDGVTEFHDICRGMIKFENVELDDLIIARSDGSPTYNFTVVVDDVTMKISHVIRGDDHINNTPRQVLLYKALGFEVPEFAHLPMIHGPDKKKLSKRHGAASVIEYKEMGYLPHALVNYLARLGWSHGDQEIFTIEELIRNFDLDSVGNSPSVFDMEKLGWVNREHMNKLSNNELADQVVPFLEGIGLKIDDRSYASAAIATERERGRTLKELADISAFYFRDEIVIDEKAGSKWLGEAGKSLLAEILIQLEKLDQFTIDSIKNVIDSIAAQKALKMLDVAQPIRVALTGTTVSPGIYEVLSILGKERVVKRIRAAIG
ncbi:MAG TPA: glutamate--tRNA ligase [bacterium]|jgi:glutamyl-tRNA synthetase|nr:glutamate--tRNA ligase [bacterium]